MVWSDTLQRSQGLDSWDEVVKACQTLPQRAHTRIHELRSDAHPGASHSVQIYSGPAVGVTPLILELS